MTPRRCGGFSSSEAFVEESTKAAVVGAAGRDSKRRGSAAPLCAAEGVSSPLRARHAEVCGSRHAEVCGSSVPGGSSGGLVVCVELAESSGCRPCTASTASTAGMALGGSRSPWHPCAMSLTSTDREDRPNSRIARKLHTQSSILSLVRFETPQLRTGELEAVAGLQPGWVTTSGRGARTLVQPVFI